MLESTLERKYAIKPYQSFYNCTIKSNPVWNRTANSLMEEWVLHNIAYMLGVKPERTGDVDFNNGDEGKGLWDFMGKL